MRRTRFQQGSLQIVKRARGRNAWEYRWYELQADGSRKRRCLIVGSVEQYPNEASAQKAVAALRADINAENPRTSLTPISVQTLIEHYREKELGANCSKTRKTQVTYEGYFNKWILPRWGSYRVTEVKAVAVEQWLRSLSYANGSKAKARNIMSAVFNHAVRWEWLGVNPIRMVRQSAKRTRIPIVLSIEQIAALLRILKEPTRTMVFLDVFTGLRVGELLGLKWKDIDFQKMEVHVIRSIVMQHVGDCKTEASRKPVPLDLRLSKVLWNWRLQSPYPIDEDWVFASPHSKGKLPYWPGSLYKAHLEPAAKEIGIVGHFGWHTFRHTYATLLKERRRREGCARANAARKHLSHSEHLRASHHANQARCAEPSCESVARQKRRKTKHRGLSDVNGRTKFWRGFASD
ncbi:MAG: site-specific integrase [Candidatus Sulfotelmatobacter sp.]|jgi:integrase